MTNPGTILNFMDMKKLTQATGSWDPSVLIVFGTALSTQLAFYQLFGKNRKTAVLGGPMSVPANCKVDAKLVVGSALFGAGWALAGFCPGPAMASAFAGAPNAANFLSAVLGGMFLKHAIEVMDLRSWLQNGTIHGLGSSLLGLIALSGVTHLIARFAPLATATAALSAPSLKLILGGGALIGLSGFLYTILTGKVMGLSGMLSHQFNALALAEDRIERFVFLGGLAAAAVVMRIYYPAAFLSSAPAPSQFIVLLSGLLVGYGTSLSNGCTSGHGLAGISRLSLRSIIATAVFFGTNVALSTFVL